MTQLSDFDRAMLQSRPYILPEVERCLLEDSKEFQERLRVLSSGVSRWCESVLGVMTWEGLHREWKYDDKGTFPFINLEEMLLTRPMCHDGIATVTECNFFLEHNSLEEALSTQVKFMLTVVLPHVYARHDDLDIHVRVNDRILAEGTTLRLMPECEWKAGVRQVSMDCGRWRGNHEHTAASVCENVTDPIHVEALTRIAHAWKTAPKDNGRKWHEYIVIPGIVVEIDELSHALRIDWDRATRTVVIDAKPIDASCATFVIPERI